MLKQHYDDADISLTHVAYWCSVTANRLLSQHIEKRDSGAFVTMYDTIPVLIDTTTGYKYIELPHSIFDFNLDDGVEYLSYHYTFDDCLPPFTSVTFSRTSAAASKRLYWTEEEKPIPSNPYFYRIANRLYLLGLEAVSVTELEGAFYQTIDPYPTVLNDDFPFPDELISVLNRYIFDLGRFVLQMPRDITNDGTGTDTPGVMPKMTSVKNDVTQEEQ
jgi:hypothetical protein